MIYEKFICFRFESDGNAKSKLCDMRSSWFSLFPTNICYHQAVSL